MIIGSYVKQILLLKSTTHQFMTLSYKKVGVDISKIKKTGWSPKYTSKEAVRFAVEGTIKKYMQ